MPFHIHHHHYNHYDPAFEARLEDKLRSVIRAIGDKIMSAISDYTTADAAFKAKLNTSLDDIKTEIGQLNDKITQLQNSSGAITPEDQALLDAAQASSQSLVDKAAALDTLQTTAPTPPAA